eukprot:GFYU01007269.1.p1 GENE.GFYU01007269.1~~GFYU01007269.1.p1  ORF type:complete len:191 (+),score=28.60 GFYU01007269.1:82-654(+)
MSTVRKRKPAEEEEELELLDERDQERIVEDLEREHRRIDHFWRRTFGGVGIIFGVTFYMIAMIEWAQPWSLPMHAHFVRAALHIHMVYAHIVSATAYALSALYITNTVQGRKADLAFLLAVFFAMCTTVYWSVVMSSFSVYSVSRILIGAFYGGGCTFIVALSGYLNYSFRWSAEEVRKLRDSMYAFKKL